MTKEYLNKKLALNGILTNNSDKIIYLSWKVERQFYQNSDYGMTIILGGKQLINKNNKILLKARK